jgi:hypothetical protein
MWIISINFTFQGSATAQAVNRRVLIMETRVRYQNTAYKIYGGWSGNVTGFPQSVLNSSYQYYADLTSRTTVLNTYTIKKLFRITESIGRKISSSSFFFVSLWLHVSLPVQIAAKLRGRMPALRRSWSWCLLCCGVRLNTNCSCVIYHGKNFVLFSVICIVLGNTPTHRVGNEHSHNAHLRNKGAQQWAAVTCIHSTLRKSSEQIARIN